MAQLRSYSELIQHKTFMERYEYLKLDGRVGEDTFGHSRPMNQRFYRSKEWKRLRHSIIVRDEGCDLGIPEFLIHGPILVHHINPISEDELIHGADSLFDPNNLICVSHATHNAIHYGNADMLPRDPVVRAPGDTKLW